MASVMARRRASLSASFASTALRSETSWMMEMKFCGVPAASRSSETVRFPQRRDPSLRM
jgi:hypothetical protein